MGLRLAQELEAVRREIDHENASARRHEARGLADRAGRIVEVVQHLVDDDEVEGVARERRRIDVALPQFDAASGRPFRDWRGRPRAWHGWHRVPRCAERAAPATAACGRCRCRDRARSRIGAGPRASSTAASTTASGACRERMRSHSGARREKKACAACERWARTASSRVRSSSSCGSDRSRLSRIGRMMRRADAPVGEPEEGPGPFPVALHEAGLDQQLQMAGDARLGLAQDVGEVGDGKLALGQQGQDPQARLLGGCPQDIQGQIQRRRRGVRHGQISLLHIKIYLYVFWNGSKRSLTLYPGEPWRGPRRSPARRRRRRRTTQKARWARG